MIERLLWITLILALIFTTFFRTGCQRRAEAANVMLTASYQFTVISNLTVTNISPAPGAGGIQPNAPISCDVSHPLPITSISMIVKANGNIVSGSLQITDIAGGKHLVFTADADYPTLATITWTIQAEVDNGQ